MSRIIQTTIYNFSELSTTAKAKAIAEYRDIPDDQWWDYVYESVDTAASMLGIEIDTVQRKTVGGHNVTEKEIYFNGFYHQGSGSCFSGKYQYKAGAAKAIAAEFPTNTTLIAIAEELEALQESEDCQVVATITGSEYRGYSVSTEASRADDEELQRGSEVALGEIMKRFNKWIYKQLEEEYEAINSDEYIQETLSDEDSGYEFTEDGSIH